MKVTKTKLAAATFGAAMSSLYSAPELNAQVNINVDANTINFYTGFASANSITPIEFLNVTSGSYQIPGVGTGTGDRPNAAIGIFNDSYGVGVFNNFFTGFDGEIAQFGLANPGDVFSTGSVSGVSANLTFGPAETGVRYIGFVAGGGVGWFSIDLGTAPNDDLTFIAGAFNQGIVAPSIVVGAAAVPEPSSGLGLAALGMGLAGLRRRRKAATAA